MKKIVQKAGRAALGDFAPEFAHYNDDILFGENWNNTDIDLKTRSLITVISLMSQGITDSSLRYHIKNAMKHGVTRSEMVAAITHTAFYAGWPKAWSAFAIAKDVYAEDEPEIPEQTEKDKYQDTILFPIGDPNPFGEFFVGRSFLAPLSTDQIPIYNVTFEPGCRNNWHIHRAKSGGGQMLVCVGGTGYYQQWDAAPRKLRPGDTVNIPAGVKHWHGATQDCWFSHLAIEVPGEGAQTEWCEPVDDEAYALLR